MESFSVLVTVETLEADVVVGPVHDLLKFICRKKATFLLLADVALFFDHRMLNPVRMVFT